MEDQIEEIKKALKHLDIFRVKVLDSNERLIIF